MTNRASALRSAFAGADSSRTDALKAISLPARSPQPPNDTPTEPPAVAESPPATEPSASQTKQPRSEGHRPRTRAAPAEDTKRGAVQQPPAPRSTIVYVTAPMRDALRQQVAREPHLTFTDLVLDALETHENDLRGFWIQPRPSSGRFSRSSSSRRGRRDEPGVQLALRLSTSNVAALDAMVNELRAPSRTALVEQALRRYYARVR